MKMKRTIIIAVLFIVATAVQVNAQSGMKIGYTDVDYIFSAMPQAKQIESELSDYSKQYQNQIQAKMTEFQNKYRDYQENAQNMLPEIRADKEQELQSMQQNIQEFEQKAQTSIQKKQMELLKPVYDKIQEAIDAVREENGYDYIFSASAGQGMVSIILSADEKHDVSQMVFDKLGVTPPADGDGAPTGTAESPAPAAGGTGPGAGTPGTGN